MQYRTGIGFDIHRLIEGRPLFLGGIEIPYTKGLLGHSDADVLIHALCDALLGALAMGDIGEHFPDTDPKYKGVAGSQLLKTVREMLVKSGYKVNNVDIVVIAQEPALTPFKKQMKQRLCSLMNIGENELNIKAKTNEGLGDIGRSEAIACYVSVSIVKA
ncbi:MAG: 2-C-methyl-D-erythritol 2,4-cyclodiphosphate synthase [Candidatus Omnitrophica bacterium]|nr:2-C-methyl-D-erythritol 2,4-cyclodiphosphate synthase [Candidatus Omnitrophota bacterium]